MESYGTSEIERRKALGEVRALCVCGTTRYTRLISSLLCQKAVAQCECRQWVQAALKPRAGVWPVNEICLSGVACTRTAISFSCSMRFFSAAIFTFDDLLCGVSYWPAVSSAEM